MAAIFQRADSPKNILIVALDFAKDKHLCLICNGTGDHLLKPFPLHNDRAGLEHLLERIQTTCKRHAIDPKNVILGGEDNPAYAENFLHSLHQHKSQPLVVRVNAWKAKRQRENLQASTDLLDLTGIAKTLINRDAYLVFDDEGPNASEYAHYDALRAQSRTRDALVKARTAISNRIHNEIKLLFPGFLDTASSNPLTPFGKASLALMQRADFHAGAFARKRADSLAKVLAKLRVRDPGKVAEALIARAREALPPRPASVHSRQQCLTQLVSAYGELSALVDALEKHSAQDLACTPAAVLTSICGFGIVTASAIAGEQGHVDHHGPLRRMASYAGIVPGREQTGGPDKPGITTKVKPRSNRRLKKHLVFATFQMGHRLGPPEFIDAYKKLKSAGQHADFIMARRLLHMSKAMMCNRFIYLPPELRDNLCSKPEQLLEYLQETWPKLVGKWRDARALDQAFSPEAPLGFFRKCIKNLYRIELPIDGNPPHMIGNLDADTATNQNSSSKDNELTVKTETTAKELATMK